MIPIILLLSGCNAFQNLKDKVDNLTNSFVVSGLIWGVEEVDDEALDLSETEFGKSASITVFLANTEVAGSFSANPISRATILADNTLNATPLLEESSGVYKASSDTGLTYVDQRILGLSMDHLSESHMISMVMPAAPVYSLPESMPPQKLVIDLGGQEFFEALVVVINLTSGQVSYDNRPDSPDGFYDLTHPNGDLLEEAEPIITTEIPASAFETEGIYAVGIAGLRGATTDDMDNVNTLLSSFIGGKFKFETVCVPDCNFFPDDTGLGDSGTE